jgi:hypothetical protein
MHPGEMTKAEEAAFSAFLRKHYPPILTMAQLDEALVRFEAGER